MKDTVFVACWFVCAFAASVIMWKAQRDWVASWLCFLGGPVGLGIALVEYERSRG